jgi:MFS family permease
VSTSHARSLPCGLYAGRFSWLATSRSLTSSPVADPVRPLAGAASGRTASSSSERRALGAAIAVTTACVLPAFLTGGLAVQMRAELGFGVGALGIAVSAFFVSSAASSALLGRVVERLGSGRGMVAAAVVSALSLLGIAVVARSWAHLVGFLVLGGVAHAGAHPATNLLLAGKVRRGRQGLAFGLKQAAVPAATLVGGLTAPLIGLTVGWRSGFLLGSLVALAVGVVVARDEGWRPLPAARSAPGSARIAPLLLPALGVGLGAAAGVSLAAFLVDAGVAAGLREGAAGVLLAAASIAAVGVRVAAGWLADRRPRGRLRAAAAMLVLGACGFVLLAAGLPGVPFVAGSLLAFGAGWGWPGLFNFAIVDLHRDAPAAATGITQTGTYVGSAIGPLAFGLVVEHGSYRAAWLCSAALALGAAVALVSSRRVLVRERQRRAAGAPGAGTALPPAAAGG